MSGSNPHLDGLIANTIALRDGMSPGTVARRYRTDFQTVRTVLGKTDVHVRSLIHSTVCHFKTLRKAFYPASDLHVHTPDSTVPHNGAVSTSLTGLAKAYTNFTGAWEAMDLSGMVQVLAKTVAMCSYYFDISTDDIRGNQPPSLIALGSLDAPVSASTNMVFIPRIIENVLNRDVLAVLVAAANATGATVATDHVCMDANTGRPMIPYLKGPRIARACVDALRIIGANYNEASAGSVYAYALFSGIHQAVTVVSHTDEGGVMRDIWRRVAFRPSYGGLYTPAANSYIGLPALGSLSKAAISAWTDALALASAAAVAHSDPCINYEDNMFPTVFTAKAPDIDGVPQTQSFAQEHAHSLALDCAAFVHLYSENLAKLLCLEPGSLKVTERHFCAAFGEYVDGKRYKRHLEQRVIAPYFWVEPSGILAPDAFSTDAERAGFGSLVAPRGQRSMPAFTSSSRKDSGQGSLSSAHLINMRNLRSSGFLLHFLFDRHSRLAHTRIRQVDPETVCLLGPKVVNMRSQMVSGLSLEDLAWERGSSPIPPPAAVLNIKCWYGVVFRHFYYDEEADTYEPTKLPLVDELMSDTLVISGGLCGLPPRAPPGPPSPRNMQQRQAAADSLARVNFCWGLRPAVARSMELSFTSPSPPAEVTTVFVTQSHASVEPTPVLDSVQKTPAASMDFPDVNSAMSSPTPGPTLKTTMKHGPVTGPQPGPAAVFARARDMPNAGSPNDKTVPSRGKPEDEPALLTVDQAGVQTASVEQDPDSGNPSSMAGPTPTPAGQS